MKSVLISIQPKWCELIASGKKTIEVRKTAPKIATPFKVYIYCTLQGSNEFFQSLKNRLGEYEALSKWNRENWGIKKGKVIGEFICDNLKTFEFGPQYYETLNGSCLTGNEVWDYGKGKTLYGWHISNLVIYDKPRELGEFYVVVENEDCGKCKYYDTPCESEPCNQCQGGRKYLTRPPQSWCYVESEVDTE